MKPLRLALPGFGTVGQWLAQALQAQHAWLQQEYGLFVTIISVATAHHGLIYHGHGLDIPTLLDLVATPQPLTAHPKVTHWTNVLKGLQVTGGDVLAGATGLFPGREKSWPGCRKPGDRSDQRVSARSWAP